jgi:hypothetical protein
MEAVAVSAGAGEREENSWQAMPKLARNARVKVTLKLDDLMLDS